MRIWTVKIFWINSITLRWTHFFSLKIFTSSGKRSASIGRRNYIYSVQYSYSALYSSNGSASFSRPSEASREKKCFHWQKTLLFSTRYSYLAPYFRRYYPSSQRRSRDWSRRRRRYSRTSTRRWTPICGGSTSRWGIMSRCTSSTTPSTSTNRSTKTRRLQALFSSKYFIKLHILKK